MSGRVGELAGHLWSTGVELQEAALRGYVQTARLAGEGRGITYAIVPDEARAMIQAALDRKTPEEAAALELPLATRCLVPFDLGALQARLVCLLPYGHDLDDGAGVEAPEHGWYRFVDAKERGDELAAEATARLETRLENARRRLDEEARRRLQ